MNEVFISYSRKDKEFIRKIHHRFASVGYDIWVDWEDIPLAEDWWESIQSGIEAAYYFIFAISSSSLASKVCRQELDHAIQCRKRLIPIVYREDFRVDQVPQEIAKLNWIFFREQDDFEDAFQSLVSAINTDLDFIKIHTRLLVRTLEWEKKGRNDDYLLRGMDLNEAEAWLVKSPKNTPAPTEQQRNYILKSRAAQTAHDRILLAGQKAKRMVQVGSGILTLTVVIAVVIGMRTIQASREMEAAKLTTRLEQESYSALQQFRADQLGALLSAVRSGQALKTLVGDQSAVEQYPTTTPLFVLQTILGNIQEKNRIRTYEGNTSAAVPAPDGNTLITASDSGLAHIWRFDGRQQRVLKGHQGAVLDARFHPTGEVMATASRDTTARLWNLAGESLAVLEGHQDEVWSVDFSPNRRLLATASADGTARLWTFAGEPIAVFAGHEGAVLCVRFHPDGQRLVSVGADQQVRLWNLEGQQLAAFRGHAETISEVRFSPDGRQLATASDDGTARLWSLDGQLLAEFEGHQGPVYGLSFSPAGNIHSHGRAGQHATDLGLTGA